MEPRRRLWTVIGLFVLAAACAAWVAFLLTQTVAKADNWSSIAGVFATVGFGIAGIVVGVRGNRQQAHDPPAVNQNVTASGGIVPVLGSGVMNNNFAEKKPPEPH